MGATADASLASRDALGSSPMTRSHADEHGELCPSVRCRSRCRNTVATPFDQVYRDVATEETTTPSHHVGHPQNRCLDYL